MILHLAAYLKHYVPYLNFVHYVSFRAMAALLSSLFFSFLWGGWFLKKSERYFRSKVRPDTPHTHESKNDMPTMGGIFIVMVVLLSTLLWTDLSNHLIWTALVCLIGFSLIGLWDDWRKINRHQGIRSSVKFGLQLLVSGLVVALWFYWGNIDTTLCLPFIKSYAPDIGLFFIPWVMFVLIGTSNAVNLTDGLDGLAIGSLLINFGTFAVICYLAGHALIAHYLGIPFAGTSELTIFGSALFGASLGFLWYNTYPAQIFMGDVGSLGLGAVLGFMALASKQELLLAIAGGLFVMETFSVIIQVLSFRLLGKRWFRMAPIHHHFELLGWQESKITVRLSIVTFVLCLITLMTLKIR